MLQDASKAKRHSAGSRLILGTLMTLLAAASMGEAMAQPRTAALGLHRPSTSGFHVDGDFDGVHDVSVTFGTSADTGLLADLLGAGTRSPVTVKDGIWRFDTDRDGVADRTVYFGGIGDKPLIGDMNLDGKDDLVQVRNGTWLVSTSGDGIVSETFTFAAQPEDKPLLGDIDGDGHLDVVIYRNGLWLVSLRGGGNFTGTVHRVYRFGGSSDFQDQPLVFDYNGDGKADLAVFRNGQWYISTNAGYSANPLAPPALATPNVNLQYGQGGDRPLYYGQGTVAKPDVEAARLLQQATFGPTASEVNRVISMGVTAWVDDQLAKPMTPLPVMYWWPTSRPNDALLAACPRANYMGAPYNPDTPCRCINVANSTDQCQRDIYSVFQLQRAFFRNAVTAPDQLRQRVAWALSQIWVVSAAQDPIAYANRGFQQLLLDHAFGNFSTIMNLATLNPFMGNYLDMVGNRKASGTRQPNENYAREILQLFSIGLWELRNDGTMLLDAFGNPIPTYDQADVTELARVYTGFAYPPLGTASPSISAPVNYSAPMVPIENQHDTGSKRILDIGVIAAGRPATSDVYTANGAIFSHPNVGPYIGKQLIQHLVTSNPSPEYVARITAVFNNNGSGVRGDLKAVVRAILLDPEARTPRNPVVSAFGKLKEPVLFITSLLRALGTATDGVDLIGRATAMGQNVYTAPTVFNYYPFDYMLPGTSLAGPQYGIFDATTYFARANWVYNQMTLAAPCTGSVCGATATNSVAGAIGTRTDYAWLQSLAADPSALVHAVNMRLLQGTMPTYMRQQIITAVSAIPVANTLERARAAVYLTASSPRFQTEF